VAVWGRRLQFLGALALMVAPFLPWAQARVLGLQLGLPGMFLHGSVCLALGLLVGLAFLVGLRAPALGLLAGPLSAAMTGWDLHWILHRTEYALRRLQLSLADLNNVLAQLNLQPIDLFTREASPWAHVGSGVWLAFAGAGAVLAGSALELAGRRCRACGFKLQPSMTFCPGCGAGQGAMEKACPSCHRPLQAGFRYCPGCGQSLAAGVGDKMIGSALV